MEIARASGVRPSAACTATVDELSACLQSYPAAFDEVTNKVPACGKLTLGDIMRLGNSDDADFEPKPSAACETLRAKCPDFFAP